MRLRAGRGRAAVAGGPASIMVRDATAPLSDTASATGSVTAVGAFPPGRNDLLAARHGPEEPSAGFA